MQQTRTRLVYTKAGQREIMRALRHMHEHQVEILERLNTIMTAFDDLTREVNEMGEKVTEALAKMQELIDEISANPGNVAAVTAAAAQLDALQTKITEALAAAVPPAP